MLPLLFQALYLLDQLGIDYLDFANRSDTPFVQRRQPGALLQTLNQHITLPELQSIGEVGQIPLSVNVDMKKFGFRTMHQSLMTASEGKHCSGGFDFSPRRPDRFYG